MAAVRQHNKFLSQPDSTLFEMYGTQCASSNFNFIGPCLPKDLSGNCQETIHNRMIDVVSCPENPLP